MKNHKFCRKKALINSHRAKKIALALLLPLLFLTSVLAFDLDGDKYEYYIINNDGSAGVFEGGNQSQTFTIGTVGADETIDISGVSLYLFDNSFDGELEVHIYDTAGGSPSSSIVSNTTIDESTISADPGDWYNFTLPSTTLQKTTTYAITLKATGGGPAKTVEWRKNRTGGGYSGGDAFTNDGSGWSEIDTDGNDDDFMFEVWGNLSKNEIIFTKKELIKPEDNEIITTTGSNFTANYTITQGNLTNTTYYLWNSTGIFNNTVTVKLNGTSNTTTEYINELVAGNYEWNVLVCAKNSTSSLCEYADSNYTFEYKPFTVINETWVNNTVEGSKDTFRININVTSGQQISEANLIYNNTAYSSTFTNPETNQYFVEKDLVIPNVDSHTNQTFYWNFIMNDNSVSNSTEHNQSVNYLQIGSCGTHSFQILNYTLRDEQTQKSINISQYNSTIEVDIDIYPIGSDTEVLNFSGNFSESHEALVCINNNLTDSTYRLYSNVRYDGDGYASEFHNIQNYSLNYSTLQQNITLRHLLDSESTTFLITYKDSTFLPVENALIDITRKYVGEGTFKTVEVAKTDRYGQATGHFQLNSVPYTIIVKKEGAILSTFENIAVVCDDEVIGDCEINLNEDFEGETFSDWGEVGDLSYSFSFDEDTRTITLTFTTFSGGQKTVSLNTTKFDRFGNDTVCSDQLTSSSGTLTCSVAQSYGNLTMTSYLYSNGELITTKTYTIEKDPSDIFGNAGIIMVFILLITLPLMFTTSKIGMILGVFLGLIMSGLLLIIDTGSIFAETTAIIWFIIAGGNII